MKNSALVRILGGRGGEKTALVAWDMEESEKPLLRPAGVDPRKKKKQNEGYDARRKKREKAKGRNVNGFS